MDVPLQSALDQFSDKAKDEVLFQVCLLKLIFYKNDLRNSKAPQIHNFLPRFLYKISKTAPVLEYFEMDFPYSLVNG